MWQSRDLVTGIILFFPQTPPHRQHFYFLFPFCPHQDVKWTSPNIDVKKDVLLQLNFLFNHREIVQVSIYISHL